jgi:hypothetical protein
VSELDLAKLDWQSLATLITGALAVGAAVLIGFRQLGITRRQTTIAQQQTRLAELTLRYQLFDRRMIVYNSTADFLAAIFRDAAYPSREVQAAFFSALGSSRFLFSAETYEGLSEIWERATDFRLLKLKARASADSGDPENKQAEDMALTWFFNRLESLPNLFGTELRLT